MSTDAVICRRPLLPDAYESLRVYVAVAPGKGEGLFARIALVSGEVVAFYNGALRSSVSAPPTTTPSSVFTVRRRCALDA